MKSRGGMCSCEKPVARTIPEITGAKCNKCGCWISMVSAWQPKPTSDGYWWLKETDKEPEIIEVVGIEDPGLDPFIV